MCGEKKRERKMWSCVKNSLLKNKFYLILAIIIYIKQIFFGN